MNLTGYSARCYMRQSFEDPPVARLTTENGGINMTASTGTIELYMSSVTTQDIAIRKGVYDIELIQPDGEAIRLLEGNVIFTGESTR